MKDPRCETYTHYGCCCDGDEWKEYSNLAKKCEDECYLMWVYLHEKNLWTDYVEYRTDVVNNVDGEHVTTGDREYQPRDFASLRE